MKYPAFPTKSPKSLNEILSVVLSSENEYLTSYFELTTLSAGQNLYSEGEKSEFVYFPETCVISHLHNLADGTIRWKLQWSAKKA